MPRPPRPDLMPIVEVVSPTREMQLRSETQGRLRRGDRLYVFEHINDPTRFHTKIYPRQLEERLAFAELCKKPVDWGLLLRLASRLDPARAQPTDQPSRELDGVTYTPMRLISVGSRVRYPTLEDLAGQLGIGRSTLIKKLGPMWDCCILCNQYERRGEGNGWLEFAADVFWNGDERIRLAYLPHQRMNDGFVLAEIPEGGWHADATL